jgi:hypothetical protein
VQYMSSSISVSVASIGLIVFNPHGNLIEYLYLCRRVKH